MDPDIAQADEIDLNAIQALLPKYRTALGVAYKTVRSYNPKTRVTKPLKTKLGEVKLPVDWDTESASVAVAAAYPGATDLQVYDETGTIAFSGTLAGPTSQRQESGPRSYHMDSIKAEVDKLLEDGESKEASVTFTVTGTAANVQRALKKVAGGGKKKPGIGFGKPKDDAPAIDDASGAEEIGEIIDDEPVGKGPRKPFKGAPKAPFNGESFQVHAKARGIVAQLIEKNS